MLAGRGRTGAAAAPAHLFAPPDAAHELRDLFISHLLPRPLWSDHDFIPSAISGSKQETIPFACLWAPLGFG